MDIHTNLPFEVEFIVLNDKEEKYKDKSVLVESFYSDIYFDRQKIPVFTEYQYIKVVFRKKVSANIQAQLYMNYFEFLREENNSINFDEEQNSYIEIDNVATIHTHKNNTTGIPLIPGYYQYSIKYENEIYYAQFQIAPQNMTINVHKDMINQIEEHSLGLARDFLRNQSAISNSQSNIIATTLDKGIFFLQKKYILIHALETIYDAPITNFKNNYHKIKTNKSVKIDSKSQALNNKNNIDLKNISIQNSKVYTKNVMSSLQNNENQYVLQSLRNYLRIIKLSINQCELSIVDITQTIRELKYYKNNALLLQKRENEIKSLNKTKKELKNLFVLINKYYDVRKEQREKHVYVTNKIMKYPGYRNIFEINKYLDNNIEDNIQNLYSFKWKSSETLYEYWSFIELIKVLQSIGFKVTKGWMFNSNNKKAIIPRIPDGTNVTFELEDIKLNLIFNKPICRKMNTKEHYWVRHKRNKPDLRLDIYNKHSYVKTIILDAKYSPADKIWKQDKVVEQLNIYKNMIVSSENPDYHVVKEVIALTPTPFNNGDIININTNFSVTIATFTPNLKNMKLIERLKQLIYL
ncbi:nuclease domain-containing protein [Staphylococcus xylosus]|uniref:nuclease domain-containing protein n=1 Tax=Staphylococcus gallinarum TaxID=1293 RepID=UPI001E5640E4|nr:nuclease domain-containing protein [Staphylococcus gallinarum]MCD8830403.1 hypothetical protein [Staphylococcus gallinarum]MEB6056652.1 hypothetical protein [Staphylococcus gallinarum]